jgi:hypothetical protein
MIKIFNYKILLLLLWQNFNIFNLLLLLWQNFNIFNLLSYFKHDLSKKLGLFCYKFMFKYLEMNIKKYFKKSNEWMNYKGR